MISRREFIASLPVLATPSVAIAESERVWRIGHLWLSTARDGEPYLNGFMAGLRSLGYAEGKNLLIEYRLANGRLEALPALAQELVNLNIDLIYTPSTPATQAAMKATTTIPIVFVGVSDPVGSGLVQTLSRPGGNVTGLTDIGVDLTEKRLDLLKQTLPRLKRLAMLGDSTSTLWEPAWKETYAAARAMQIEVIPTTIKAASDIEHVLARLDGSIQALLVAPQPVFYVNRQKVIDFTLKARLPATYEWRTFVEDGGLMSYGPDYVALHRKAARHVDRVLKGVRPAALPVEQPTDYEFVINLKAARAIGLQIPESVLVRADEVIS
jgi:putative ABC transport system substrate-binding protein